MIKNRTFLLLAANVFLAIFIVLNLDDDNETSTNFNSELSEMVSKMTQVEFLQPSASQKIILKKDRVDWQIKEPISWPAEPISMADLVSKMSHLEATFICYLEELESMGEIPADYGFDENSSSLHLLSANSEITITIGSLTRDQTGRFLLFSNEEMKVILHGPRQIENLVNRPLNEWAELTFFNLPLYAIDEFNILENKGDDKQLSASLRKSNEEWFFAHPSNSSANGDEVMALLHKLTSEKLVGFAGTKLDENMSEVLEMNVRSMGKTLSLLFHHTSATEVPKLLVKSTHNKHMEQSFYVAEEFLENFRELEIKLRQKRLFSLELEQVNRIKITEYNSTLTLRKNMNDNWIGLEDNGTDIFSFRSDNEVIRQLISELNTIEVTDFIQFNPEPSDLQMQGFETPSLRLEIELDDSTRKNIFISKTNTESSLWSTYVTEQALICLVNSDWSNLLSTHAIDYKDRMLLPEQFQCDQIILKSVADEKILATISFESNGESFARLLGFKADFFVDLSYNDEGVWVDGDWLPWKYSISFGSSEENSAGNIAFHLTERMGGTKWYAGSEELGLVCNLPIFVIDELAKELQPERITP